MRQKICPQCRIKYTPIRSIQPTCGSFECQIAYGLKVVEKRKARARQAADREHRERKAKAKTKADHTRETQAIFNRWIRKRDEGYPCISCGRHHQGQNHAGHYRSTKAAPELRFNELNVNLQCSVCNVHLSGNAIEYRIGLVRKIGVEQVEFLEGKHEPKRYTIEDLKGIKAEYSRRLKI